MTPNPSTISPELFKTVNADVCEHIRKKLLAMNMEAVDLELHNSSLTKTLRVYVCLKRSANLKALALAEHILIDEIARQFSFRPHAFYWRHAPEASAASASALP